MILRSLNIKKVERDLSFLISPSLPFPFPLDHNEESESDSKDWVFQNFTFKRFEGLTQRGHVRL